jgi:hypothetical protein
VFETISVLYVNSDTLVDIVKKLFVKSPDGESSLKQSSRHTVPAAPLIIPLRTRRNANCEFGRKLPDLLFCDMLSLHEQCSLYSATETYKLDEAGRKL